MKIDKKFLKFWLPVIIGTVIIFILSVLPDLETPAIGIEREDLIAHFSIYFILGILVVRGCRNYNYNPIKISLCLTIVGLFGIIIEIVQIWIPGRSFEFLDIVSNLLGVIFSAIFIR